MLNNSIILQNLTEEQLVKLITKVFTEQLKEFKKELNQTSEGRLLSIKELSEHAGVSEQTIRNWILEGKVEAKRIGRRVLIEQTQFDAGLSEVKSLKYKR